MATHAKTAGVWVTDGRRHGERTHAPNRSRLRDVQGPHRAGRETLCGQPARYAREAKEGAVVAEEVDALDALRLLRLALTRVFDATVASDVRVANTVLEGELEEVELGLGGGETEGAVEGVQDVAQCHVRRGPGRVGCGGDGDCPGEMVTDDGERGESGLCGGLGDEGVGEPRGDAREVGELRTRGLGGLGEVPV